MRGVPYVYAVPTEGTSPKWCNAFARGCGGQVVEDGTIRPGSIALWGSPDLHHVLQYARTTLGRAGGDWYYGDHAYFGRGKFYRITRNRMQHDGLGAADPARFLSHGIPIKDWRTKGDHILLVPNSEAFLKREGGYGPWQWVDEVTAELRKHTDRPTRLRWKTDAKANPLENDLVNCWATITFTSNSCVDGILAGIPAFCTRECAALAMGSNDLSQIERPRMPATGRLEWAAVLAANQWSFDEMARGDAWRVLGGDA